jgi:hypothetical protein
MTSSSALIATVQVRSKRSNRSKGFERLKGSERLESRVIARRCFLGHTLSFVCAER